MLLRCLLKIIIMACIISGNGNSVKGMSSEDTECSDEIQKYLLEHNVTDENLSQKITEIENLKSEKSRQEQYIYGNSVQALKREAKTLSQMMEILQRHIHRIFYCIHYICGWSIDIFFRWACFSPFFKQSSFFFLG